MSPRLLRWTHWVCSREPRAVRACFCPDEPVRRWTMAVWLVRVLEESEPRASSSRFADVDDSEWWMPYVERLAELGITAGCASEPARFCPEDRVTRAHTASLLSGAFGLEAPEGPPAVEFSDVGEGPHTGSIYALVDSGITAGCASEPEARFCPDRLTTRGQMASFLKQAYSAYVGPCPTEPEPETRTRTRRWPWAVGQAVGLAVGSCVPSRRW